MTSTSNRLRSQLTPACTIQITYGLYLSDHTILDGVDTELVVLSGIMLQNLKTETAWHLRGEWQDLLLDGCCAASHKLTAYFQALVELESAMMMSKQSNNA